MQFKMENIEDLTGFSEVRFKKTKGRKDNSCDDFKENNIPKLSNSFFKQISVDNRQCSRCTILSYGGKVTTNGEVALKYFIKFESSKDVKNKKLILKEPWTEYDWLRAGMLVNIMDAEEKNGEFMLNDRKGFLIIEPDTLIPVGVIASQHYCGRKAALSYRIPHGMWDNASSFRGNLAHDLIYMAMKKKKELGSKTKIQNYCQSLCEKPEMLEKAYGANMTDFDLSKMQKHVTDWVFKFISERFRPKKVTVDSKQQNFKFVEVISTETTVSSKNFGMIGKVDAIVKIKKNDGNQEIEVPLEFKTGIVSVSTQKPKKSDNDQVSMYGLIMEMDGKLEKTLLYYISNDSIFTFDLPNMTNRQRIVKLRNNFVRNIILVSGKMSNLPKADIPNCESKCKNCNVRTLCGAQIGFNEDNSDKNFTDTEKYLMKSVSLKKEEFEFFNKWWKVINLETGEIETEEPTEQVSNIAYQYLLTLMDDTESAQRLRDYMVNRILPEFSLADIPINVQTMMNEFAEEEKVVITKALKTDSFLFVNRKSQEDKTKLIASLLRAFVESGKTVLIVTETVKSLDSILSQYKMFRTDFIKVTGKGSTDKTLEEFLPSEVLKDCKTIGEVQKALETPMVVGGTLNNLKHSVFKRRHFDYCIVEESTQVLATAVFGALSLANKYILFGDMSNSNCFIKSKQNREMETKTIFDLFAKPEFTINLN